MTTPTPHHRGRCGAPWAAPWWTAWLVALVLGLGGASRVPAQQASQQTPHQPPQQAARQQPATAWRALARDGVHDPRGPAIGQLQEPGEALSALPPDGAGNNVHWIRAIESGAINPRSQILPGTVVRTLDQDIIVAKFGSMPAVKFPHRQHTLWLDCSNCHDKLFKAQAGANVFSMAAILNGEQCGLCHGAVAFPLTECNRCHSVPNASLQRRRPP